MKKCILCGEDLDREQVNLEHYVPATAIRNFDKLTIPSDFNWALRINIYKSIMGPRQDRISVPLTKHKEWATVRVHQRCNQDASPMCRDLKYLIDNPGRQSADRLISIRSYYAHIWQVDESKVGIELLTEDEGKARYPKTLKGTKLYERGRLDLGRIIICVEDINFWIKASSDPGVEKHEIWIGTRDSLVNL